MIRRLAVGLASAIVLSALALPASSTDAMTPPDQIPVAARTNPLLKPSALPFGAPPFDRIQDGDFAPAFEAGMKSQLEEVAAIAGNPAAPNFENTLVALEKSGQLLGRVSLVFNGLTSANTNPALQTIQQAVAPKLASHQDAILLNGRLFTRVETVYRQRDALKLDPESSRLVEYYYQRFVRAGARLSDADKTKLRALNEEDASLSAKYIRLLLNAAKEAALVVGDAAELAGLSTDELETASLAAKSRGLDGKWLILLLNTTQHPMLPSLTNRATREQLFRASWTRTERGDANDTRQTIATLADLRARKAGLLGYPNIAAWVLEDQMAKTPAAVDQFLARLIPPATANARAEARDIQALIDQQRGNFSLEPWDWDFYAEQVRKARYDLDGAALMPYFELDRVLRDGVFYAAQELYGLTFKERHDIPVYQKDVRVFEVIDRDGTWHGLPVGSPVQTVDAFETAALKATGLDLPQVPPRYRSSYFLHIWANGYAAGYYAYLWAEMLDNDAFAWFTEHGGLTRANGDRFRDMILSRGNAGDYARMYRDFRGQDPSIEPMLKRRGIAKQ
jgi:peptidyl-dipeptidase Dcp